MEEKGAADLGKDGAVGKDDYGIDSAILVGGYPVVTLMWQSERKRAGGEILVCLLNGDKGIIGKEERPRAGLLDGVHQGGS